MCWCSRTLANPFRGPLQFEWRLIDWGIADVRGHPEEALYPELCADDLYGWEAMPGFRFADGDGTCHGERSGLVRSLYLMLRGDNVLDADVAHWIREGFADKTGLRIPQSLTAAWEERQKAEKAVRAAR